MSGTNWLEKIASSLSSDTSLSSLEGEKPKFGDGVSSRSSPQHETPPLTGSVKSYSFSQDKWQSDPDWIIKRLQIRNLWKTKYLLKFEINEQTIYFCGHEETYLKVGEDKNRRWLFEIVDYIYQGLKKAGFTLEAFNELSFGKALHLLMIQQVLGGKYDIIPF